MVSSPEQRPPVEIDVSARCDHGCFVLWTSSPSVWRFHDGDGYSFHVENAPNQEIAIHDGGCLTEACRVAGCWSGADTVAG